MTAESLQAEGEGFRNRIQAVGDICCCLDSSVGKYRSIAIHSGGTEAP